jgi:Protein of unknown function (DUF3106)
MKMRQGRIFSALAFAFLLAFAAQPASAQRHAGAPPPARYGGARVQNHPRQQGLRANRPLGNPAGRPANTFHPPSTYQPAPGAPGAPGANGQAANGNAAHPPNNTFRPPANSNAANGVAGNGTQGNGAQGNYRPGQAPGGNASGTVNTNSGQKLPGQWEQKLGQMSPQQQNHFLQNNERFKSMPPERQQQIRQNLQNYNRLSPTEKMAMKDRQATWERMSPEQRNYVQHTLLPKWQQMSPDRKQMVTDRLHTLQGMSAEDRQKSLNDPQFMRGLSPDEQSVLRGLDQVRNPSNP